MNGTDSPFDFITPEHFTAQENEAAARSLFSRSVNMVEVEVFSFCNRRCWFCPNSSIDRVSRNNYMDEDLYLRILADLGSIAYSGVISYSRYNEPLADRTILKRLRQAHTAVPRATLHTNTNADYLNLAYLHELYASGLRSLSIQAYLGNNDRFDDARMLERMDSIVEKLALPAERTVCRPGDWHEYELGHRQMKIRLYARNFERNGVDRAGLIEIAANQSRTSPCLSPFEHFYVDWDGSVMPCCNTRSDAEAHRSYIIGNLRQFNSIFSAYGSQALTAWRRELGSFGAKAAPCTTCAFRTFEPTPGNLRVLTTAAV